MKVSDLIINEILNNNDFSLDLAKFFGIQQQSLRKRAQLKSKKLGTLKAIKFYIDRRFLLEDILVEQEDIEWVRTFLNHHKKKEKV